MKNIRVCMSLFAVLLAAVMMILPFGALAQTPAFSWTGEGDKPIVCDDFEDHFFITWPEGVNADALTAQDIVITMKSERGDVFTLDAEHDYAVFHQENVTCIAMPFKYWPYTPVYTTITIAVADEALVYDRAAGEMTGLEQTFDIASVYAYEVQQGGGMDRDLTVVAYSFYGVDGLESADQVMAAYTYTLQYTDADGNVQYYAEKDGKGVLTAQADEAMVFDATCEEERNVQLIGNTVYVTRLDGRTADKDVEGKGTLTFSKVYSKGGYLKPAQTTGLTVQDGFVFGSTWLVNERWSKKMLNTASMRTEYTFVDMEAPADWSQVLSAATYTLQFKDADGKTWYYGEDADGKGKLVEQAEAITYDDSENLSIKLDGNVLSMIGTGENTVDKTVGDATITFTKKYSGGKLLRLDQSEFLKGQQGYIVMTTSWAPTETWPEQSGAVWAGIEAEEAAQVEETANTERTLTVDGVIYGSAFTDGKSTLKAEKGVVVTYTQDTVTLSLGEGADDSLIDASEAVVTIGEGYGYMPEELILKADKLTVEWKNGQTTYTLNEEDILWSTGDYAVDNGGREWSVLGGDGNGDYFFNFVVSGLKYDGAPVEPASFVVHVKIYGR